MPTDYRKLLEACPLVDAQQQARIEARRNGPGLAKAIAADNKFMAAMVAEGNGALAAQPELNAIYKEGMIARERQLESGGQGPQELRDELQQKYRDGQTAQSKAIDVLRNFCKSPSS